MGVPSSAGSGTLLVRTAMWSWSYSETENPVWNSDDTMTINGTPYPVTFDGYINPDTDQLRFSGPLMVAGVEYTCIFHGTYNIEHFDEEGNFLYSDYGGEYGFTYTVTGVACTTVTFGTLETPHPYPLIAVWTHNLIPNTTPLTRFQILIQNSANQITWFTVETAYTNDVTYTMTVTPDYITKKYYRFIVTAQYYRSDGVYVDLKSTTSSTILLIQLSKAINPTPSNDATNVTTYPSVTLQWQHGNATYPPDSYKVYVGGGTWLDLAGQGTILSLSYSGKIYGPKTYWQVDAIYGATTVTGDVWEFTPAEMTGYTLTVPSDPTPIDSSSAGYFGGISCAWKGDSRSSEFEVWSAINGGVDILIDTIYNRTYSMAGLADGDTVIWHVKEKVILNSPSAWVEGPSWSFTVQTASYPGGINGAVPMPTVRKQVICCDNKLYYGEL